ncbi:uncharacterized protein LOC110678195 [Aedes aegypti]|nr:uncharacterized protein LOC110678195 [Aedes aegypti]
MLLNASTFEENYLLAEIYKEFYDMKGRSVQIQWIPSHKGIDGNEKVDQEAVNKTRERQTFFNGITMSDAIILSNNEVWDSWTKKYKKLSDDKGKWHFQILEKPCRRIWNKNMTLNSEEVKIISRIRTGHCLTKDRKAKWKWEDDELCEWCETTEDLHHILYDCPRYNQSRVEYPSLEYMKPLETILSEKCEEEMKQIVKFLKENKIHI